MHTASNQSAIAHLLQRPFYAISCHTLSTLLSSSSFTSQNTDSYNNEYKAFNGQKGQPHFTYNCPYAYNTSTVYFYTVFQKKQYTKLISVTLSILNGFSKFFHRPTLRKMCEKQSLKFPSHLKHVAKLPYFSMKHERCKLACALSHSL